MSVSKIIRIEVQKIKSLPPLSSAAQQLIDAVNDPDIRLEVLAARLERCPSISARLLGLANSAYFGMAGRVNSIRQAVIQVLGLATVKSLSISLLMAESLNTKKCPNFPVDRFWFLSVLSADLARKFAAKVSWGYQPDVGLCYTAGLLADLGILALVHVFPEAMSHVFEEQADSGEHINVILQEWYGVDQFTAGGWLAARWHFPQVLCEVIEQRKQRSYAGPNAALVGLIQTATEFAGLCADDAMPDDAGRRLEVSLGIPENDATVLLEEFMGHREELRGFASMFAG